MFVQNSPEIPANIAPAIGDRYVANSPITRISIAADACLRGKNVVAANPAYRKKQFIGRLMGRPLLFYGALGLLLFLVGSTWGIWIATFYRHTGQFAVGYALICALLCLAGHLALTAGIILHSMRSLFPPYLPNRRHIATMQEAAHSDAHEK